MAIKKSNNEFIKEVYDLVGDEYVFLEEYINSKTKILCKHNKCNHEYKVSTDGFFNRSNRCPKCYGTPKKSNNEFLKEVHDLVGDEYTFLEKYVNTNTRLKVIHNKCGYEYEVTPNGFLNKKNRCPKCYGTPKKSNKEFTKEVYDLVGKEYTFLEKYVNTNTRLKVIHNKCGYEYEVTPNGFFNIKNRCPKCANKLRNINNKKSNEEFIKEVYDLVGNEYKFLEEYRNFKIKLKVIHNRCGYEYEISPNYFLQGNRCPKCYGTPKKSNKEFTKEVYDLVGKEYTFLEKYVNTDTKLKIIHNKCGYEYEISPNGFFNRKNRCPKCSFSGISKSEKSVLKFIKKVYNGKIVENDRKILGCKKEIDIYLPDLKIGIEYCGLYWHSEKYLDKNYHLDKLKLCHEKGIRLLQIFEDEWVSKNKILKSKIKHILGLNTNKESIYARKCTIKEIDSTIKNEFLDKYHIQGKDISKIKLGLFYNEKLVSVITFSKPRICMSSKNRNMNNYELSRFATKRKYNVVGGFSKLLSYFKKNYEFDNIITYADLRYSSFEGNLYEVNGFKLSHQSKPNYWYFYKNNSLVKFHRFNFRKGNLKKLFPEIYDDNLTEHEIMLKSKYLRIYDCGCLVYKY